jgi:hypothetical protein
MVTPSPTLETALAVQTLAKSGPSEVRAGKGSPQARADNPAQIIPHPQSGRHPISTERFMALLESAIPTLDQVVTFTWAWDS